MPASNYLAEEPSVASAAPTVDVETAARLRIAIGRLSRRVRSTAAGAAAGLTPTRISVLLTVVREGPIRLADLASIESLNPTMLSRAVSNLGEAGLVARVSDDGDRRAAWVQATLPGQKLAEGMRHERTGTLNRALEGLSADDLQLIERALPALEDLAELLNDRHPDTPSDRRS